MVARYRWSDRFEEPKRTALRRIAAGALGAAALVASLERPHGAEVANHAQEEIRTVLEKWQTAFNDRDEQQVCGLFAQDLIANYEGQPEQDYASLCGLLHTAIEDRDKTYHYSFSINDILIYGDAAVVRLVWTLEVDKIGASKEIIEEPAVDIFRHQGDGSWKISRYLAYSASR